MLGLVVAPEVRHVLGRNRSPGDVPHLWYTTKADVEGRSVWMGEDGFYERKFRREVFGWKSDAVDCKIDVNDDSESSKK
jgi:hypothetical protein